MTEAHALAYLGLWIAGFFTIVFILATIGIEDIKITWTIWLYLILSIYLFCGYAVLH